MRVIFRRELDAYMHSLTGQLFIAVLLCFIGIYFTGVNLDSGYPYFSFALVKVRLVYVLFIPILTMRSFAEERRSKTDQFWMTAPISVAEAVIGKFFAMASVLAAPLLVCCIFPVVISLGGTAHLMTDYLSIIMFFLLGCVYISIGMLISALTDSQVIAAVGSFAALFLCHIWDSLIVYVPQSSAASMAGMLVVLLALCAALWLFSRLKGLALSVFAAGAVLLGAFFLINPDAFQGLLPSLLERHSLYGIFRNFAYYMVFDLSGLVLYLSLTALMIYTTVQVTERRRWDTGAQSLRGASAQSKQGLYQGGLLALASAVVLTLNILMGVLPISVTETDMSESRLYSLSTQSIELLEKLDRPVTVTVVAEEGTVDARVEKFLTRYAAASNMLSLEWKDPVKNPSVLDVYETQSDTVVVDCASTGNRQILALQDMISYNDLIYQTTGVRTEQGFDCEGLMTGAVDFVISGQMDICCSLTGHGETELSSAVLAAAKKAHFNVEPLNILADKGIPEDCKLLICSAPAGDLSADEAEMLDNYIDGGGRLVLLFAEKDIELPNWTALLNRYGLILGEGYTADLQNYYDDSYYRIFPVIAAGSPLTAGIENGTVLIQNARVLMLTADEPAGMVTDVFMTTSGYGCAVTETTQEQGLFVLGCSVTNEKGGALVAFASASLISPEVTDSFTSLSNIPLFANAIGTGSVEGSPINIPAKNLAVGFNTVRNGTMWSIIFTGVLPTAILAWGLVVWLRRRSL